MAIVPHNDGLYQFEHEGSNHANVATEKMSISKAHHKLRHISHTAIKHVIASGHLKGINLDMDLKPEFCKPCAKAKSAQPFPNKSDTRATEYGEHIHWDLWGPVLVRSLSGNSYCATHIDDHSHETCLYFQPHKSNTMKSHKQDEVLIETHSENKIKFTALTKEENSFQRKLLHIRTVKGHFVNLLFMTLHPKMVFPNKECTLELNSPEHS